MLRLFEVHQKRTGRADCQRIRVDSEAFEAAGAELLFEPFFGGLLHEGPFFDGADVDAGELFRRAAVKVPADDEFLRGEGADESFDVFETALRYLERSGGDVQERCPDGTVGVEFQAAEEVVLLLLQHTFGEGHAGREDLRDAALHKFALGELRVFQLVAHSNLVACPHQFGKILLQGVMRHSGHFGRALFAVGAMGEHQAEELAHEHCIVGVCLIEIPHPVEQDGLGMQRLRCEVLLEHRGIFRSFCHNPVRLLRRRMARSDRFRAQSYKFNKKTGRASDLGNSALFVIFVVWQQ